MRRVYDGTRATNLSHREQSWDLGSSSDHDQEEKPEGHGDGSRPQLAPTMLKCTRPEPRERLNAERRLEDRTDEW